MKMSLNTQATLLLTGYFSGSAKTDTKPLTVAEWARFVDYLKKQKIQPSQFLAGDCFTLLDGFSDKSITQARVSTLMKRGAAMALSLEKWSRANIWVLSRADEEYPLRLKKKLGPASPPILYGCGNKKILGKGGIGVVGSRKVSKADLAYTSSFGSKAVNAGFSIVSGGAKGVDQAAMMSALDTDGEVIGVMADSLLRASSSSQYRNHIMRDNLVLISPFYPEAGFNAGNAMQRNKYIYCLSEAAVVVHSGKPEGSRSGGGTWTGALENLKKNWVPLWVKETKDVTAGNSAIVEKGALWLDDDIREVDIEKLPKVKNKQPEDQTMDLFAQAPSATRESDEKTTYVVSNSKSSGSEVAMLNAGENKSSEKVCSTSAPESLYVAFLLLIEPLLLEEKSATEIAELLDLNKTQLNTWLKTAVDNQTIVKTNRPVRYQWAVNHKVK